MQKRLASKGAYTGECLKPLARESIRKSDTRLPTRRSHVGDGLVESRGSSACNLPSRFGKNAQAGKNNPVHASNVITVMVKEN
mmetsp:Transcript_42989/g.68021  ORF Transcript_42989/g.68021 Transcript_42989/m.68021 type:complete len:83 (+) Transcript_42989:173-421(+)|eukprot:CAMPEP_0169265142 /NCGR_PEP_ID=MMETSP1016-20121227/45566_1 /TAXON_ID=342587 /ORGANISM="Karlodinium micrum, Strain CCMP2283" /LENGTH=82 /DNA_ID=CAMNT_0009348681 /DNA_START=33 /DNA_END=284 /DNA_ORIENTATION=+